MGITGYILGHVERIWETYWQKHKIDTSLQTDRLGKTLKWTETNWYTPWNQNVRIVKNANRYIQVYRYTLIHINTYKYTDTRTLKHIHSHVYTYTNTLIHIHPYTYTRTHTPVHIHQYIYTNTNSFIYTQTLIHWYRYRYTTHTHTPTHKKRNKANRRALNCKKERKYVYIVFYYVIFNFGCHMKDSAKRAAWLLCPSVHCCFLSFFWYRFQAMYVPPINPTHRLWLHREAAKAPGSNLACYAFLWLH